MKHIDGQQDQPRGRAENILNGDTHSGLEQHEREVCAGVYDEFHGRDPLHTLGDDWHQSLYGRGREFVRTIRLGEVSTWPIEPAHVLPIALQDELRDLIQLFHQVA